MPDISSFFAGLEDDTKMDRPRKPGDEESVFDGDQPRAKRETFPCMSCRGTGQWQPRGGSYFLQGAKNGGQCFACGGRGCHDKPHAEKMRDKAQAKAKREAGVRNAQQSREDAFDAAYPGLREWMAAQTWSTFLQDMLAKIVTPYGLSERQIAAIMSTRDKCSARKAEKVAQKLAAAPVVDLATIESMFDKARAAGLRKLAYRARGLVISPAKENSRNPGAIYVKTRGGDYLGKVQGGRFQATFSASDEHKAALQAIAKDPAGEAIAYGKETRECSCCGRELSDPESVRLGIGPICRDKWF